YGREKSRAAEDEAAQGSRSACQFCGQREILGVRRGDRCESCIDGRRARSDRVRPAFEFLLLLLTDLSILRRWPGALFANSEDDGVSHAKLRLEFRLDGCSSRVRC